MFLLSIMIFSSVKYEIMIPRQKKKKVVYHHKTLSVYFCCMAFPKINYEKQKT